VDYLIFITLVGVLTLQGLYLARRVWLSWEDVREDSILLFVLYTSFFWALTPAYVALLTDSLDIFNFGYELEVWSLGLLLDVVFFSVFILVYSRRRVEIRADRIADAFRRTPYPLQFLVLILVIAGCGYALLMGPWTTGGYGDVGLYVKEELTNEMFTIGGVQQAIYLGILVPAICVLLFYVPRQRLPKWMFLLVGLCFGLVLIEAISSGIRSRLVDVLLAVVGCMLVRGYRKRALAYLIVGGVLLAVLSAPIVSLRSDSTLYGSLSPLQRAGAVFQSSGNESGSQGGIVLWASTFLVRLASVQDGGILASETAKSGEYAYFRPFVGSIVGLIPRYLWHSKPLPLSRDGTVEGLPWYLVMAYRDEPWNNGSVSTSGIAYWQFGWIGVFATAAIGAWIVTWLARIAFRGGIVGLFLFLSYSMMIHFRFPVGVDETLMVLVQMIVPFIVLRALYLQFAGESKRKLAQPPPAD
jgi:hypothetical protein